MHIVNPLRVDDSRFGNFRATLDAKMKHLNGRGIGMSSKQAKPLTPDEKSLLWTSEQLTAHSTLLSFQVTTATATNTVLLCRSYHALPFLKCIIHLLHSF